MNGFLFDSNVLLDIITLDPVWQAWSEAQVIVAIAQHSAFINPIIYAELVPAFASPILLERWLDLAGFQRLLLPYEAGWRTGKAFQQHRRAGGTRRSPMPDFYIGAHAEVEGLTLVTRDVVRYRTYFPMLSLITP